VPGCCLCLLCFALIFLRMTLVYVSFCISVSSLIVSVTFCRSFCRHPSVISSAAVCADSLMLYLFTSFKNPSYLSVTLVSFCIDSEELSEEVRTIMDFLFLHIFSESANFELLSPFLFLPLTFFLWSQNPSEILLPKKR
jgi:hypothetical protein